MAGPSAAAASRPNKELESKVRNLKWVADDLRKKVFEATQRGHQLASRMGFNTIEDAEETIAAHQEIFNRGFLSDVATRFGRLRDELEESLEMNRTAFSALEEARETVKEVQEENAKLQEHLARLGTEQMPTKLQTDITPAPVAEADEDPFVTGLQTPVTAVKARPLRDVTPRNARVAPPQLEDASSPDPIMASTPTKPSGDAANPLHLQLQVLQRKYDDLLEVKEKNDAKHREKFEKWRKFKAWLAEEEIGPQSEQKASYRKKIARIALEFKLRGPRLSDEGGSSVDGQIKEENISPGVSTPKRKRKFDETTSSDTENDSQAPSPVGKTQPGLHVVGSGSPRKRVKSLRSPKRSPRQSPRNARNHPTARTLRKSADCTTSSRSYAVANGSMSSGTSPAPLTSKFFDDNKTPISSGSKGKGKENIPVPGSSKRPEDYSIYKGRGRYGNSGENTTINAAYQIDPAHNAGLDFQFDEVIRNKEQRRHLPAGDCECCRDYYETVGPLPPRPQAPLWRSPESTPSKPPVRTCLHADKRLPKISKLLSDADADFEDKQAPAEQAIAEHRHQISRHRHQWERAKTPPGYWNIGFPTTQEAAVINAKAQQMHEEKRRKIVVEARRGGKYKKR